MKKIALIFAGGVGQRMGAEIPKQFLKVCGKEIIIRTIEIFEKNDNIDEIYVVCIESWIKRLEKLINLYEIDKVIKIIPGGTSGQDSIYKGLIEIQKNNNNCYVLIHDGVRPLVSEITINKCIKSVQKKGSAITVTKCFETPVISDNGEHIDKVINRSIMYTAQAPQCFELVHIIEAHEKERKKSIPYDGIVDSCSLMKKYGYNCYLIEGNRGNVKVTTVEDLFNLISNYNYNDYKFLLELYNTK